MKPLIYIFSILCLIYPLSANAQQVIRTSSSEDVALLFYKTGKAIPNFTRWVEENPEYHHTPSAKRDKKMIVEKNKLVRRYQDTNPQNDLIKIKIPVEILLRTIEGNSNNPTHILSLKFAGANNIDYFPYKFIDQNIAVIPTNLKDFKNNRISKRKFEALNSILKNSKNNVFSSIIELQAKKADMTQPYDLDNINQWIFKAQIAIFSIIGHQDKIIWEKTEPWYTSPITEDLNGLYSGQYKEELEYIDTE